MWSKVRSYLKNILIMLLVLAAAYCLCILLNRISESDFLAVLVYILAVLFISLMTNGYIYGIVASVIAVVIVNVVFTYPYYVFNFSIPGYVLTFISMFAVSFIGSGMITGIKKSEEFKQKAQKEAVRSNLLRSMAHDYRTPITAINGSLEFLQKNFDKLPREEIDKLLNDAKSEAEWLNNMADNLLSITRIGDDAEKNIKKEPVPIEEILAQSVQHLLKFYPEYQVRTILPDKIIFVNVDYMLIGQVINNILINSCLHGGRADKTVIEISEKGGFAEVSLTDNGNGFPRSVLDASKKKFSDIELIKDTDSSRGIGIGLALCDTIIKAHGGKISLSNTSEGARVVFTLPIYEVDYGEQVKDIDS